MGGKKVREQVYLGKGETKVHTYDNMEGDEGRASVGGLAGVITTVRLRHLRNL